MTSVGALRTCILFSLLASLCVGQTANSPAAKPDIRPAIFQRGSQAVQVVESSGPANAQLSSASLHLASAEEVDGMEKTLEQYVIAFESFDLAQIKQIWPELDAKHTKAFKEVFSAMKGASAAPRLGLQCLVPDVSAGLANVQCMQTVTYNVGKGKTQVAGPAKVSIQLKGESSHWVMHDMRGSG